MELQSIILLGVLIVVLAIATVMIIINRRLQKTLRERTHQEPTIGLSVKTAPKQEPIIEEAVCEDEWVEEDSVLEQTEVVDEAVENDLQEEVPKGEFIVLGLIADENHPYAGYELLQSLLSAGLRFGAQQIFHRHEGQHGRGEVLFSCASATAPGTFELNKMGGFSSPALSLFLNLSETKDASLALEAMLDTARQITEDLGGSILDDERQILSDGKVRQWQRRVKQIEESRHTADLFAEA